MTKRRAIEIFPGYADAGVQRWAGFGGKPAILEATGQTFEEVRALRVPAAADAVTAPPLRVAVNG